MATDAFQVVVQHNNYVPALVADFKACSDPTAQLQYLSVLNTLTTYPRALPQLLDNGLIEYLLDHVPSWPVSLQADGLELLLVLVYPSEERHALVAMHPTFNNFVQWQLTHWHRESLHVCISLFALSTGQRLASLSLAEVTQIHDLVLRVHGQPESERLLLSLLVRAVTADASLSKARLEVLASADFLRCLVGSMRGDDADLTYWSLGLLFEMTTRCKLSLFFLLACLQLCDQQRYYMGLPPSCTSFVIVPDHSSHLPPAAVAKVDLQAMPKLLSAFHHAMNVFEAGVQKVVLRAVGSLCLRNDAFKHRVLNSDIVQRICSCLNSSDEDLSNWAVVVIHDLCMLGPHACKRIVEDTGKLGPVFSVS